ncbi:Glutamine amidotransferase protein GlxB [Rhodospirillaceae bacterium LM-1]|nr:Glutamine amidotransferase protein GlxB [Rhodospirillaceae bacterium LM-1]
MGRDLIAMLDGCQHRGPDSTGFALYADGADDLYRLRFYVGEGAEAAVSIARIKEILADKGAELLAGEQVGGSFAASVRHAGDVRPFAYAMEHAAKLFSLGHRLEIVKDEGTAHEVDARYHLSAIQGTHGLGHVRLATESAVRPEAAHPFWATGFSDIAIVHNGQITNYWKWRRRLEKLGFEFRTDNDSELIAVYLAKKLSDGASLKQALTDSIEDMDGTFSFLVSTGNEIGYAKDRLAAKPMVMVETDQLVAIASEEVSLNRLFPGQALSTREPLPGTIGTWSR